MDVMEGHGGTRCGEMAHLHLDELGDGLEHTPVLDRLECARELVLEGAAQLTCQRRLAKGMEGAARVGRCGERWQDERTWRRMNSSRRTERVCT